MKQIVCCRALQVNFFARVCIQKMCPFRDTEHSASSSTMISIKMANHIRDKRISHPSPLVVIHILPSPKLISVKSLDFSQVAWKFAEFWVLSYSNLLSCKHQSNLADGKSSGHVLKDIGKETTPHSHHIGCR